MNAILDLLKEIPLASIKDERMKLALEQAAVVEKENASLRLKVAELETALRKSSNEVARLTVASEYVEHRGALFKRSGAGFVRTPYCPDCKKPMNGFEGFFSYACDPCDRHTDFKTDDLDSVIKTIPH